MHFSRRGTIDTLTGKTLRKSSSNSDHFQLELLFVGVWNTSVNKELHNVQGNSPIFRVRKRHLFNRDVIFFPCDAYRSDDDSDDDYEMADHEINNIIIVTQTPPATKKHPGGDRTGYHESRSKITTDLSKIINDGLYYYELDLWEVTTVVWRDLAYSSIVTM